MRSLRCRELQEQCCSLLSGVFGHMLGAPAALPTLGAMLPAILATLVEAVEAEHVAGRPMDAPNALALLGLIRHLTLGDAGALLQPYLKQVWLRGCARGWAGWDGTGRRAWDWGMAVAEESVGAFSVRLTC